MKVILCALMLALFGVGSAAADVTFCNKTSAKLQIAVAHSVTKPYATKEISGWHVLAAGECTKLLDGNFLNEQVYYLIAYADGARAWATKGADTTYPFCVQNEAFVRHGAYSKLQYSCPSGWLTRQFYGVVVEYAEDTLNLYD